MLPTELSVPKKIYRFSEEQTDFIIRYIAWNYTSSEIIKEFKQKYDHVISYQNIYDIRDYEFNQPSINKYRRIFEQRIISVPLASKRRRVEELNKIYNAVIAKGDYALSIKALETIKFELEGGKEKADQHFYFTNFVNMTPDELDEKLSLVFKERQEIMERINNARQIGSATTPHGDSRTQPIEITQGEQVRAEHEPEPAP